MLLYAAAGKKLDPEKHHIALRLLREERLAVSTQVIGEFYHNARRKFAKELSIAEAHAWVDALCDLKKVDVDLALIRSAMFIAERYKVAFWDAALIAACERVDAPILYTEDLSHGQKYGSVAVINPFQAA